jgi:hypothetical protein
MYIKNIPIFNSFELKNTNIDNIIYTVVNTNNIEIEIEKILDKYDSQIQYYIDCNNSFYCVSIKNITENPVKPQFNINVFKNEDNIAIIILSNDINEYEGWNEIKRKLLKNLTKKN